MQLTPLRTIPPTECVAEPSAERCECPSCNKLIAGGAIVKLAGPEYFRSVGRCEVIRGTYCDHCNHWFEWRQAATFDGGLVGRPLPHSMIIVRDRRRVAQLLKAHPECAGVEQS